MTPPPMLDPSATSRLLCSLERVSRADSGAARLLVAPVQRTAVDLLEGLARRGVRCDSWSVITPRALASSLVSAELVAEGVRAADDLDEAALVDAAFDAYLAANPEAPVSALDGQGFRAALVRSVRALRIAGVDSTLLASASLPDPDRQELLRWVLAGYEQGLRAGAVADPAALFGRALEALRAGRRPFGRIHVVPGVYRGLTGTFLRELLAAGAELLATDPVEDMDVPAEALWSAAPPAAARSYLHAPGQCGMRELALEMFSAASPVDELREVLRRAIASGRRWEDVEIVAADAAYAPLLDGLARRLDIPVEYGEGLPVGRTRTGRAVGLFLDWLEFGFRVEHLRPLLESGDLDRGDDRPAGPALARRLAALGVVRGRARYVPRVDAAIAQARHEDQRAELRALRDLLHALLEVVPGGDRIAPGAVAAATRQLLGMLAPPLPDPAREVLESRLERIAATLGRRMPFAAAVAAVRAHLHLLASAVGDGEDGGETEPVPPHARGILLSSLRHGGRSGRRHTFVVGISADAFPGAGIQDPLLTDEDRRCLARLDPVAGCGLPTQSELLAERKFSLAGMLAGTRDHLTLSFPGWDPAEARPVAPSAILLQALRLREADPAADYDRLRAELRGLVGAVPRSESRLDAQDVWFGALQRDGVFLNGIAQVRAAHRGLDRGLAARDARAGSGLTAYHGAIAPRPEVLDPRRNHAIVVSASRLETLGRCPHLYLLKYVLRAQVPDRGSVDPDSWLDPRARGTLLHQVFEHTLRAARDRGIGPADGRILGLGLEVLDAAVHQLREEVLPPSDLVFRRECQDLRRDLSAWAASLGHDGAEWVEFELAFGAEGDPHPAVPVSLPGGTVLAQGAIDRVDRLADGRLRIVDYKTGSPAKYSRKTGVFDGGRRIQHFLYTSVAETLHAEPVARMEYRFPTQKGQNASAGFDRADLAAGADLLGTLLSLVEAGDFVPTESPVDCGYCDYRVVCRVAGQGGDLHAPLAAWAKARAPELPAYTPLLAARNDFA